MRYPFTLRADMDVPKLIIPNHHCEACPTAQGIREGHDPEVFDILTNEPQLKALQEDIGFDQLWCPWRQSSCVVYPVEQKWAKECFAQGITPPVKLHPRFTSNPTA